MAMMGPSGINETSMNSDVPWRLGGERPTPSMFDTTTLVNTSTRMPQSDFPMMAKTATSAASRTPPLATTATISARAQTNVLSLINNFEAGCTGEYDRKWILRFKEAYCLYSRNIIPRSGDGPHSSIARWINLQRRAQLNPKKKELFVCLGSI